MPTPFDSGKSGFRIPGVRACLLFACSEAYPLDQAGAAELAPVEVLNR